LGGIGRQLTAGHGTIPLVRLQPELELPAAPRRPGAPPPALAMPRDPAVALRWGVDLWNHGFVWEAHEVWESLWRAAAGDDRRLLQGLIQAAAAQYARAARRELAADRLAARALARLAPPFPAGELGRVAAQVGADPFTPFIALD
jgi:hypothetical protein